MYCNGSPKATVNYNFAGGENRVYVTDKTPIQVDVSERYTPKFAGGQCPVQYWVDYEIRYRFTRLGFEIVTVYFNGEANRIPIHGKILDIFHRYNIGESAGGKNSIQSLNIVYLDYRNNQVSIANLTETSTSPEYNLYAFNEAWTLYDYTVTSIRRVDGLPDNCGEPEPVCKLKVLHNNQIIFTDQGKCPPSFNVICGDECPPDHIKCSSSGYPGYCCIPCGEVAAELRDMKNQVKSINNG